MRSLVLALAFYFALVTGGMLPITDLGLPYLVARGLVLASICFALTVQPLSHRLAKALCQFILFSGIIVLSYSFNVEDTTYALKKADGLIFGTVSTSIILYALVRSSSMLSAFHHIQVAGGLVLGLTIVYKSIFGFWDREVVFLMNGPIVFGWLMGMLVLMAGFLYKATSNWRYLASSLVFFAAVLWTESKGPLVALIFSSLLFILITAVRSRKARHTCAIFVGGIALLLTFGGTDILSLDDTRFAALARIATNQLEESDAGSVNARTEMLEQGINLIFANPITGTGFGGWQKASNSEFNYPHNVSLEIFVEFGIILGFIAIILFLKAVIKLPLQIRFLVIFFIFCNSLSGDASYLRFPLCFMLVAILMKERSRGE